MKSNTVTLILLWILLANNPALLLSEDKQEPLNKGQAEKQSPVKTSFGFVIPQANTISKANYINTDKVFVATVTNSENQKLQIIATHEYKSTDDSFIDGFKAGFIDRGKEKNIKTEFTYKFMPDVLFQNKTFQRYDCDVFIGETLMQMTVLHYAKGTDSITLILMIANPDNLPQILKKFMQDE